MNYAWIIFLIVVIFVIIMMSVMFGYYLGSIRNRQIQQNPEE